MRVNDAGGSVGRTYGNKTSMYDEIGGDGGSPWPWGLNWIDWDIQPRIPVPGRGLPRREYSIVSRAVARVPGRFWWRTQAVMQPITLIARVPARPCNALHTDPLPTAAGSTEIHQAAD